LDAQCWQIASAYTVKIENRDLLDQKADEISTRVQTINQNIRSLSIHPPGKLPIMKRMVFLLAYVLATIMTVSSSPVPRPSYISDMAAVSAAGAIPVVVGGITLVVFTLATKLGTLAIEHLLKLRLYKKSIEAGFEGLMRWERQKYELNETKAVNEHQREFFGQERKKVKDNEEAKGT